MFRLVQISFALVDAIQPRNMGGLEYIREVGSKSFQDAWSLVFEKSLASSMIGLAIFGCSLFVLRRLRKHEDVKLRVKEFGQAALFTGGAFLIIWAIYFVAITPKQFVNQARSETREEKGKRESAEKERDTARNELHTLSPAGQTEEIGKLKSSVDTLGKKLEEANSTITRQQSANDPLNKPITSARFTLLINFKEKKEALSNYFGSGAGASLGVGDLVLLGGATADHNSDGNGHSRVVFDCPFDVSSMGKPVRSLSDARFLELQFADGFVPIDTELDDSRVVIVINNEITLNFEIPAQSVTRQIDRLNEKGTWIRTWDIQKGLAPLTKQPSPTPDMEASRP